MADIPDPSSNVQVLSAVDVMNLSTGVKMNIRLGTGPVASKHRATFLRPRQGGDILEVRLPFGQATVGREQVVIDSGLRTEILYPLDEPVKSPYGLGLVNESYMVGTTKMYQIDLTDWIMADGSCAVASVAATELRRSYSSNTGQLVRIIMRSKLRGDAAFKARDVDAAVVHYLQSVAHVREWSARQARTDEQAEMVAPVLARLMGNLSQAHMTRKEYGPAVEAVQEAISGLNSGRCPPEDVRRLMPKFQYRLGQALYHQGQLQAAQEALTHPAVVEHGIPEAARLAAECKSKIQLRRKKSNRSFRKAFQKKGLWGGASGSTAPKSDASEEGTSPVAGQDGKSAVSAEKSVSAAGAAAGGANGSSAASGGLALAGPGVVAEGAHSTDSESLIADSKAEKVAESLQHNNAGTHVMVAQTKEGKGVAVDDGAIEVEGGKGQDQGWSIAFAAGIAIVGAAALALFALYRNRPGKQ